MIDAGPPEPRPLPFYFLRGPRGNKFFLGSARIFFRGGRNSFLSEGFSCGGIISFSVSCLRKTGFQVGFGRTRWGPGIGFSTDNVDFCYLLFAQRPFFFCHGLRSIFEGPGGAVGRFLATSTLGPAPGETPTTGPPRAPGRLDRPFPSFQRFLCFLFRGARGQ